MAVKRIYLLDTNIISELTKPLPSEKLLTELDARGMFSAISASVWYETLRGIEILPEGKKKKVLSTEYLDYIQTHFSILPYDEHCASLQAAIFVRMKNKGTPVPIVDAQIAATALANNLVLVTRNVKDFEAICSEFPLHVENWFE
ncbi:MAG: PIN domain-containing protein [Treponema sp.]|nr:PIN domain-containing protein [Treponema sp.]